MLGHEDNKGHHMDVEAGGNREGVYDGCKHREDNSHDVEVTARGNEDSTYEEVLVCHNHQKADTPHGA